MKRWAAFWLAGLMLVAGCASTPRAVRTTAPAAAPAPREQSNHLQPLDTKPVTPVAPPKQEDSAERILAVNPTGDYAEDFRWAGIDEENHMVVAAAGGSEAPLDWERHLVQWIKNYPVDRMIFYSDYVVWGGPPHLWSAISVVTRQRYSAWPTKPDGRTTISASEWKRQADFYAERNQIPAWETMNGLENEVRKWLEKRMGERLVQFELKRHDSSGTSNPNRVGYDATITVKAAPGNDQQRLQDAAALVALLDTTRRISVVVVNYDAATGIQTVEKTNRYLTEWNAAGGSPANLPGYLQVDGVWDESKQLPHPAPSHFTPADLSALLSERDQLKKLVPAGGHLTIGKGSFGGMVAIEADIDPNRSWEDVWTSYHQIAARLFKQEPRLGQAVLILRKGQEVQFIDVRGDYLDLQAKLGLADLPAPSVFPLTAAYFDQYTLTGR